MNPNENNGQDPIIINPSAGEPQQPVAQPPVVAAPTPMPPSAPQPIPAPAQPLPLQPVTPQVPAAPQPADSGYPTSPTNVPTQANSGAPSGSRGSSKKPLLIAGAIVAVLLLVGGVVGVMATKDSKNTKTTDSAEISDQPAEHDESLTSEQESEVAAKPQESTISLNKVAGGDLGKTVTVTKMIQNFPHAKAGANEETILIEIKSDTDGSYTGTPSIADFRLVLNGEEYRADYSVTDAVLAERSLTPYATQSAKVGAPAVGYVGFTIPRETGAVTFRYLRGETRILGGQTYAAKAFDVVIRN